MIDHDELCRSTTGFDKSLGVSGCQHPAQADPGTLPPQAGVKWGPDARICPVSRTFSEPKTPLDGEFSSQRPYFSSLNYRNAFEIK